MPLVDLDASPLGKPAHTTSLPPRFGAEQPLGFSSHRQASGHVMSLKRKQELEVARPSHRVRTGGIFTPNPHKLQQPTASWDRIVDDVQKQWNCMIYAIKKPPTERQSEKIQSFALSVLSSCTGPSSPDLRRRETPKARSSAPNTPKHGHRRESSRERDSAGAASDTPETDDEAYTTPDGGQEDGGSARICGIVLRGMTVAIDDRDNHVDGMCSQRRAFTEALAQTQPEKVQWRGGEEMRGIGPDTVRQIVSFFFDECLGPGFSQRISAVVSVHNKSSAHVEVDSLSASGSEQVGLSGIMMAESHAVNTGIPQPLRDLFQSYASVASGFTPKALMTLHRLRGGVNLSHQYAALVRQLDDPDSRDGLRSFLNEQGFHTRRGVSWTSTLRRYLLRSLGTSGAQLNAMLNNSHGVAELAAKLGLGVLLLLPANSSRQIAGWKLTRRQMTHVADILTRHVPGIASLCIVLRDQIYAPIERGVKVQMRPIMYREDTPLLQQIEDAQFESELKQIVIKGPRIEELDGVVGTHDVTADQLGSSVT